MVPLMTVTFSRNCSSDFEFWFFPRLVICTMILSVELNPFLKTLVSTCSKEFTREGLPGGPMIKNPPANAEDTGSILDPGRSHMLQSN